MPHALPLLLDRCNAAVAGMAEGHQVTLIIAAAISTRQDVMHIHCRFDASLSRTFGARWVGLQVAGSQLLPAPAIAALGCRAACVVILLLALLLPWSTHRADARPHQPTAARLAAWDWGLTGHRSPLHYMQ